MGCAFLSRVEYIKLRVSAPPATKLLEIFPTAHCDFRNHNAATEKYCLLSYLKGSLRPALHVHTRQIYRKDPTKWHQRLQPRRAPLLPRTAATKVRFLYSRRDGRSEDFARWYTCILDIALTFGCRYDQGCHHQGELLWLAHCVL